MASLQKNLWQLSILFTTKMFGQIPSQWVGQVTVTAGKLNIAIFKKDPVFRRRVCERTPGTV